MKKPNSKKSIEIATAWKKYADTKEVTHIYKLDKFIELKYLKDSDKDKKTWASYIMDNFVYIS